MIATTTTWTRLLHFGESGSIIKHSMFYFNQPASRLPFSATLISTSAITSGKRDHAYKKPLFDESSAKKFARRLSIEERNVLLDALRQITPDQPVLSEPIERPSSSALYHLAFHQALPFIGFGFLDNLIMIMAGEYIDHTIGLTLSISTMAAAALGNTISDIFGVGSAWYVEHWASKLGVSSPQLTLEQLELPISRVAANIGRALGVGLGCILGMAPLLFAT